MARPKPAAASLQHWVVSSIVLILLLVAQQAIAVPGSGRVTQGLQNALHGPWFAAVTWFVLKLTRRVARGWVAIAVAAVVAVGLAAGSEAVQIFIGRDASLFDVGLNLLGGLAALCVACAGAGLIRRTIAVAIAWGAIVVSAAPLARALAVEAYQTSIAPDLVRIDSPMLSELLGSNSAVEVIDAPETFAKELRVTLAAETWPGIHLDEPVDDWSPYSALRVDAFVEGTEPLPITLGVHLQRPAGRIVYRTFDCLPGPCRLVLTFDQMFDLAVARVRTVVVHSTRLHAGRVFRVARIALQQ